MAMSTSHNQSAGATAVSTSSSHKQSAGLMATSTSCNQHTVTSQEHGASTLSHNPSMGALSSTSTSTSRNQHTASSQRQGAFVTSSHDQSVVASTSQNRQIASSQGQGGFASREQSAAATSTSPDQHTASSQRQGAHALTTSSRQLSQNDDDESEAGDDLIPQARAKLNSKKSYRDPRPNDDDGNDDDESEAGDNPIPQARAKRNSKKSHRDPLPNHLGFYSGTWYDVLVEAKNRYRLFIHTQNPFPERNRNGLKDAQECLLETIAKYEDNGIQLDKGILNNQSLTYCY